MSAITFLSLLLLTASAQAAPESTTHATPEIAGILRTKFDFLQGVDDYVGRKFNVEIAYEGPQNPGKGQGGSIDFHYLRSYFGYGLRLRFGSMQLNQFFSPPTPTEAASVATLDPNSEINRPREDTTTWSYLMIEPNFLVTTKLFPMSMKKWTETARFGIARATFKDSSTSAGYSGWVFSTEALLHYHFSYRSPISVFAGVGLNWGWLVADGTPNGLKNESTLPICFGRYTTGLNYAF